MEPLKLAALDEEDLEVMSAFLQDAVLTVGDIAYLPRDARFAMVACRFAWEQADPGAELAPPRYERRRAGLHFERVLGVRTRGIDRAAPGTVLQLLAIRYTPTEAPAGTVDLVFAGGRDIRLTVECVEAAARDLGPSWSTARCPCHSEEAAA